MSDPTVAITVNIPVALKTRLDEEVVEQDGTRSGFICIAVREWLERQEREGAA